MDIRRVVYVSSDKDFEKEMQSVGSALSVPFPKILLALQDTPEGAPYRTAKMFLHHGFIQHKEKDDSGRVRVVNSELYVASGGGQLWDTDFQRHSYGFFVTGDSGRTSVWRVFRLESDAFRSTVVTLSPVVLAGGFPELDLSTLADPLSKEIYGHYEDLQRHTLSHAYRAAITSAKNVAEAILSPKGNFSDTLTKMCRQILEAKDRKTKPPHPELSYHLAEKLRLLHQYTHPGGAVRKGRPVSPEFALTVAHDLIEILRELGYARD